MKVDKNLFYNSIDRAALLTNEADKNTIKLESTKNTILVSSNIPEVGNVEEKIKEAVLSQYSPSDDKRMLFH